MWTMQSHEQPLARAIPVRPELKRARVGPKAYAPSVTVRSLDAYLRECARFRSTTSKSARVVYRGQTQEYVLEGEIISLLTGRERQSSDHAHRYNIIYGYPDCVPDFFEEFLRSLRVFPRSEREPFPFDKKRPQAYFEFAKS